MKSVLLTIIITVIVSIIPPVFADIEQSNVQYPGIPENMIKTFFGEDGINTEAEHANAVLANDLFLIDTDFTEANISNEERKIFWVEEYYWPVIALPFNSTTVNLSYFPVENTKQMLDKISVLYPDSNFVTTEIEFTSTVGSNITNEMFMLLGYK